MNVSDRHHLNPCAEACDPQSTAATVRMTATAENRLEMAEKFMADSPGNTPGARNSFTWAGL
jgi:hypothetical protein